MADPNPTNHWDSLLSDIGATPPPDGVLHQPEPKEPPAAKPPKPSSPRRAPPAKAANWDVIAGALGIQPAPQPAPATAEPSRVEVEPPVVPEPAGPTSITPERGEESPNYFDEPFDFEEPFDLWESEGVEPHGVPQPVGEEPAEKRSRKRRRRRPGKDYDARKPAPAASDDVDDFAAKLPADDVSILSNEDDEFGATDDFDQPRSEPADEQRRSKRRRPRKSKKRKPDTASKSREIDGEEAIADEEDFDTVLDEDDDLDADRARQVADGGSVRAGFRGIPTWDEAVGLLIEKNLENRSKRPDGGSQRGRGRKRRS
ncbi:MAG: hypothetical protein GX594_02145 [Pirellulaceae bacterium]|nr:hypothetical protein [Pirellulaceae bacterium]